MNMFKGFMGFLSLLPYITAGADVLHQSASGADKKQTVMALAGLALKGAEQVTPTHAGAIEAALPHVSNAIDGIVGALNALGILKHKADATPAPAA